MANIAICCDGTWNTPEQMHNGVLAPTNVVRIYNALAETDEHGALQVAYYHPGVGTSGTWWDRAVGGGAGVGLNDNIMSAYQKLCHCYHAGDQIYLFGFSRGAYTVRSLCGLISACGLLKITTLAPAEVWQRIERVLQKGYRRKTETRENWDGYGWEFHNSSNTKIPIHFIGVWDTVGALGVPDDMALLNLLDDRRLYTFHDTSLSPSVKAARHALAMDEKRASFQPTLWSGVPPKSDVKQLWFPGVHSDVGGGYRENGLADAALKWMIDEASSHGLKFTSAVDQVSPNYHDMMHDSCDGVFSLLPTQPRSIPNIQEDEPSFHISAIKRRDDPPITQSPYRKGRRVSSPLPLIIDVSARVAWNETGVWLQAGVQYEFSASGEWLDGTISCGPSGTADGRFQAAEVAHLLASAAGKVEGWYGRLFRNPQADFKFTKRHEDYDWFSLVGAIANSCGVDSKEGLLRPETFLIGDGCVHTPDKSGYLYVYANDAWNCYENNRGHVALSIMV